MFSCPYPRRLPSISAHTSPVTPQLISTTVPPAKSAMPILASQPVGAHTQCASGAYTSRDHMVKKINNAENFMRSAQLPVTTAGVIMAKLIWNIKNTLSGIVVGVA